MVIPKSSNCCFIHKTCAQQLPTTTYSASVVDNGTLCCFFENHDTSMFPKNLQVPEVFFYPIYSHQNQHLSMHAK